MQVGQREKTFMRKIDKKRNNYSRDLRNIEFSKNINFHKMNLIFFKIPKIRIYISYHVTHVASYILCAVAAPGFWSRGHTINSRI